MLLAQALQGINCANLAHPRDGKQGAREYYVNFHYSALPTVIIISASLMDFALTLKPITLDLVCMHCRRLGKSLPPLRLDLLINARIVHFCPYME